MAKVRKATKGDHDNRAVPLFSQKHIEIPIHFCEDKTAIVGIIDGWVYIATDQLAVAKRYDVFGVNYSLEIEKPLKGKILFSPSTKEFYYNKKLLDGRKKANNNRVASMLGRYLFNLDGLIFSGVDTYRETENWLADVIGDVPCLCNRDVLKRVIPEGKYGITQTLAEGYDNLVLIAFNDNTAVLSPLISIGKGYEHYHDIIVATDILGTTKNIYAGFNHSGEMFVCKKDLCVVIKTVKGEKGKARVVKSALNCKCGFAVSEARDRVRCLEYDWSEKADGSLAELDEKNKINTHLIKYLQGNQKLKGTEGNGCAKLKSNNIKFFSALVNKNIEICRDLDGVYEIVRPKESL